MRARTRLPINAKARPADLLVSGLGAIEHFVSEPARANHGGTHAARPPAVTAYVV